MQLTKILVSSLKIQKKIAVVQVFCVFLPPQIFFQAPPLYIGVHGIFFFEKTQKTFVFHFIGKTEFGTILLGGRLQAKKN